MDKGAPPGLRTLTPLAFLLVSLLIVWVLSGFVFGRPDLARAALDALMAALWWSLADWGPALARLAPK